jgi:hypothetical protein
MKSEKEISGAFRPYKLTIFVESQQEHDALATLFYVSGVPAHLKRMVELRDVVVEQLSAIMSQLYKTITG